MGKENVNPENVTINKLDKRGSRKTFDKIFSLTRKFEVSFETSSKIFLLLQITTETYVCLSVRIPCISLYLFRIYICVIRFKNVQ